MNADTGPKQTEAGRLGNTGEAYVTYLLRQRGLIVHPVHRENDFGFDGRVEVTSGDGIVLPSEFYLQIKSVASATVTEDNCIRVHPVKTTTVAYWLTKLSATLLVVYSEDTETCYWQWADIAIPPMRLIEALRDGQKTLTPRLPCDNTLAERAWPELLNTAHSRYAYIAEAANNRAILRDCLVIYRVVSDAVDILFDYLIAGEPEVRGFDQEKNRLNMRTAEGLTPSPAVTPALPVNQIYATILAFRSLDFLLRIRKVAQDAPDVQRAEPLFNLIETTAEVVRRQYLEIYRSNTERVTPEKDLTWAQLAEWALYNDHKDGHLAISADNAILRRQLRLVALTLRDMLRQMREFFFPDVPTTAGNPMAALSGLAFKDICPASYWEAGEAKDTENAQQGAALDGDSATLYPRQ